MAGSDTPDHGLQLTAHWTGSSYALAHLSDTLSWKCASLEHLKKELAKFLLIVFSSAHSPPGDPRGFIWGSTYLCLLIHHVLPRFLTDIEWGWSLTFHTINWALSWWTLTSLIFYGGRTMFNLFPRSHHLVQTGYLPLSPSVCVDNT